MNRSLCVAVAMLLLTAGNVANAGDSRCFCLPWCNDDYCAKPLPCLHIPHRACRCDDYRAKSFPKLPCPPRAFRASAFCPKPLPRCINRVVPGFYSCGKSVFPVGRRLPSELNGAKRLH